MKSRSLITMLTVLVSLLVAQAGYAAVTLSLAPSGTNRFVINGSPMDGVAALDFTITYDSNLLASPVVEKGSVIGSALLAANPNTVGAVHIAIVNATPFKGSGPVAFVTFTGKGSSTGNLGITASVVDKDGRQLSVIPIGYTAPVNTTVDDKTGDKTGDEKAGDKTGDDKTGDKSGDDKSNQGGGTASNIPVTVGTGQTTWLNLQTGTVAAPTPAKDRKEEPAVPTAEPVQEPMAAPAPRQPAAEPPVAPVAPVAAPAERKTAVAKGVLAKFRDFKGERTPKALQELFKPEEGTSYRQQPPVALSDGVTAVKVRVAVPATAKNAPNFALKDAKLVSLRRDADGAWVVEAKPAKGVFAATVIMLLDGAVTEMPVVVAPPTDITVVMPGVAPTEAEFSQFLKERGTDKAPRFDLNKDGKRDYLDDYIFTANYLAMGSKNQAGVKPVKK
ncbi:cohesin domain-containing protein [Geomobilimonas luticola]|uniref:Cohesin domain-containing protein n=1 Tax=Geomobilimonas luticola TaxID=1114878 RepID=A0ABS5SHH8_9BACT|nr:cohesin domain-containing protein [Geomobilimonas luticola]MBT0653969.1 cohesin domain-containing protein [Geomobilimonas luticola]